MDQEEVGRLEAASVADMSDRRRVLAGAIISVGYLVIMAAYFFAQQTAIWNLTPNEWGDFLAGTFAPLAFLWLVLGFFQQGVELRNSTRALLIQAEELRNSVEQQRELVRVTTEQLEYEKGRTTRAEEEADRLARPKLIFKQTSSTGTQTGANARLYAFRLTNAGATCTDVRIFWQTMGWHSTHVAALPTGEHYDFHLELTAEQLASLILRVSYIDGRGNQREEDVHLTRG
jgi:hypothetical protein